MEIHKGEIFYLTDAGFVQINIWCYLHCKRLLSQKLNAKSLKLDNNTVRHSGNHFAASNVGSGDITQYQLQRVGYLG